MKWDIRLVWHLAFCILGTALTYVYAENILYIVPALGELSDWLAEYEMVGFLVSVIAMLGSLLLYYLGVNSSGKTLVGQFWLIFVLGLALSTGLIYFLLPAAVEGYFEAVVVLLLVYIIVYYGANFFGCADDARTSIPGKR